MLKDPAEWQEIKEYRAATSVVTKIPVVNDFAEHGVAMIQECGQVLTRDEELEMARAHFFEARTVLGPGTFSPVTVIDPATRTKNKA